MMSRITFEMLIFVVMQSKYHANISIFSKIIKVMEKTQTIHLLLTFQLSSLKKGSKMYWKTFDDSEFKSGQFLQKKFRRLSSKK